MTGDPIHITWTVSDHSAPARQRHLDRRGLSLDRRRPGASTTSCSAASTFTGTLQQGDSYTQSLRHDAAGRRARQTTACIVRTNIFQSVYEGAYAANNTTASADRDHVAVADADDRRAAHHHAAAGPGAAVPDRRCRQGRRCG